MLPAEMTVIEIAAPGGPEVLRPARRPLPLPGTGEVLIKVAAAGVNRPDVLQRLGAYPPPPGAPAHPGLEVSGEIAAVGEGVTRLSAGDRVCALVAGGGYATYCLAPAEQCLPVPRGVDLADAAALPECWCTAWSNLVDRGRLQPGQGVLIHGGGSGVGVAAIQLARLCGAARVFCTAGTDEKCRACERLGADAAINYRREDFAARVQELTGGEGVDIVLDMVGGSYLDRNLRSLAEEGRLVIIAVQGGLRGECDLGLVMRRRLVVTGSTLRPRPVAFKGAIARALEERVWPAFADGRLRVVIDSRFPLEEARAAHARLDHPDHLGKVLLLVSAGPTA